MEISDMDRTQVNKVRLGQECEDFLRGPIGRHLCSRAERERAAALETLATCNLSSSEGFELALTLQRQVAVLDTWQQWIAEAIQEGYAAERQLIEGQ